MKVCIRLLAASAWMLLVAGCGDIFRPVATPIAKPAGDPQAQRNAIVLSDPGGGVSGVTTQINVSGDTLVTQAPVGALGTSPTSSGCSSDLINFAPGGGRVFIPNTFEDTITAYLPLAFPSIPTLTISLPQGAAPVYVQQAANGTAYVALCGRNSVGVLNSSTFEVDVEIKAPDLPPLSMNSPYSIAVLPDSSKVYSINKNGTKAPECSKNTVSVIQTRDNTVSSTICVGSSPVWSVLNTDGSRLFVVNQGSGDISVIDTGSDSVTNTITVGSAPNYAIFDSNRNRLYVTNSGSGTLSVIAADPSTAPFVLATVTVGAMPKSVTALADGSRVYVANAGAGGVSVVNTLNFSVRSVSVGVTPLSIASSADSSKVYVANNGSNTVSIIRTIDDTAFMTFNLPAKPVYVVVTP